MELREFLETVVTTDSGWFVLLYCHKDTPLDKREQFFGWPDDIDTIIRRIKELAIDHQVYFSPYLFKEPSSTKAEVLPSKTIVADLDEANILYLNPRPSILVRTSPGRHQGYWLLSEFAPSTAKHEELSQRITYSIPRCDRGGWFLGKKVRLPETQNFKYNDGPKPVDIIKVEDRRYNPLDLESIPTLSDKAIATIAEESDISWLSSALELAKTTGPLECLSRASAYLPERVLAIYDKTQPDRSRALWDLEVQCVLAGASKEEIFIIAKGSANNKFADLLYGADEALAYDINRAFSKVGLDEPGTAKAHIESIRYDKIPAVKKKQDMSAVVVNELNAIGQFIHCSDGTQWYIREDIGRPVPILMRGSEPLQIMLETMFGINPTEPESSFVCAALTSLVSQLPQTGIRSTLTYFDEASQSLFLHTGRKEVLRISSREVRNLTNGYQEIIFPWNSMADPLVPIFEDSKTPWWEELFGDCFENILSLPRKQAMALLRAWVLTILFRNAVMTRPILALVGQPGCLSGDTKITVRRGEHSARTYTLKEIFTKLHNHGHYHGWDTTIPTRIQSLRGDVVQWCNIHGVVSSGKKATFKVTIAGRKPFRATAEHKFLTPSGYRLLSELRPGDAVVTQGSNLSGRGRNTATRRIVTAKFHPHARQKFVNGYGPYCSILRSRAAADAKLNNMSVDDFLQAVNNPAQALTLVYAPQEAHFHHKDFDPTNDSPENIEILTKEQHDRFHGQEHNVQNFGYYSGRWSTAQAVVESIEFYGEEETYDIQMEDQSAPNFLVNGVVVHNSGKSTLCHRIYTLLYGPRKALGKVTNADNFDTALANDPLTIFDNVDTPERWLPDRLALAAGNSELTKRKLYTNTETITLQMQGYLGITAHNPQFGREDVADRFLLLQFERLPDGARIGETDIINRITRRRHAMWGAIVQDIQTILSTPQPQHSEIPDFRVADFARIGFWISRALGDEKSFADAIQSMKNDQRAFNLEEDHLLVEALRGAIQKQVVKGLEPVLESVSAAQLWQLLEGSAKDQKSFRARYHNAVSLGKKIWSMQDSLKALFKIEWTYDTSRGARVWNIREQEVITE